MGSVLGVHVLHPYDRTGGTYSSNALFLRNGGFLNLKMMAFHLNFVHANLLRLLNSEVVY